MDSDALTGDLEISAARKDQSVSGLNLIYNTGLLCPRWNME